MLGLAIKSQIPIVSCTTTDLINLSAVLGLLTENEIVKLPPNVQSIGERRLYWTDEELTVSKELLEGYLASDSTLLLVNPSEPPALAFHAGEVPVPRELLEETLALVTSEVDAYIRLAAGLTIKQTVEVIKLTQAEYGALTPEGFRKFRTMVAGSQQGLRQVELPPELYVASARVSNWVALNRPYFLKGTDPRLVPRGVLLSGVPGTGKTMGAKYIANCMGVPLFRLDLSSSLGKYVGESESNLTRALDTIDREAPCVLLIDEVEKLFAEKEDSGVTSRLLSQLLWWLQEHKSKVLTVMTTNDTSALPPELIRAGRIDRELVIPALTQPQAIEFAHEVLGDLFPHDKCPTDFFPSANSLLIDTVGKEFDKHETVAHAAIVSVVYDLVKAQKWAPPTED